MRKIINRSNYVEHFTFIGSEDAPVLLRGENFTKPSETVPGMAIPLRTLLDRYVVNGTYTGKGFQPVFSDDPDFPDNFERMSELDRLEAAHDLSMSIADERRMLAERQKARNKPSTPPPSPPASAPAPASPPPEAKV